MKYGQSSAGVLVKPAIKLQDPPFCDNDDAASSDETFDHSSRKRLVVVHGGCEAEKR